MSGDHGPSEGAAGGADGPMTITKVTYDGEFVTVYWAQFTEPQLSGYLVTINQVDHRMDNYQVTNPAAVSRVVGYTLQAGFQYQCWVTPTKTPLRFPDDANASAPKPIPYNP